MKHLIITGRVQGVGYRAWVCDEAIARGLRGWVRNRRDGSVEAVFAGDAESVDAMIAACRNGPSFARVDHVMVSEASDDLLALGESGFTTLPTI